MKICQKIWKIIYLVVGNHIFYIVDCCWFEPMCSHAFIWRVEVYSSFGIVLWYQCCRQSRSRNVFLVLWWVIVSFNSEMFLSNKFDIILIFSIWPSYNPGLTIWTYYMGQRGRYMYEGLVALIWTVWKADSEGVKEAISLLDF